jgi:uncharacterized protein YwqG
VRAVERAELERRLRERCPTAAGELIEAIEPCVVLSASRAASDSEPPVGTTKIGGGPDLPGGVPWPEWVPHEGEHAGELRPLAFICQVNLAELASAAPMPELPEHGVLSFFADPEEAAGLYPEEQYASRVLWFEEAGLERHAPPAGVEGFTPGRVVLRAMPSVPPIDDVPDEEYDAFDEIVEELLRSRGGLAGHQLLGHADHIQHPVEEEAVQGVRGCYSASGFDHAKWERVKHEVGDWRPLLQIGSDDELDLMWGDAGCLYWVIRRDALAERRFDQTWFVFQCS